ncbi:MAG: ribosome biogenesis GTPase Der [Actinomycetaceae bacterium]|nr:ribosome biogenesis GTPase Der [Actinomycetaceae bacterium]MDY6083186.1 ribosome biogenesis GTPase Der [Actinomycetaceae bacterium]
MSEQTLPQHQDWSSQLNSSDAAALVPSNLEGFSLSEADIRLIEAEEGAGEDESSSLPVLAVIGRPNVGKSSLVNRIVGQRMAVVQDTPGVTRDRVSYPASWSGKDFLVVDTGGWEVDVTGIDASVAYQAERAIDGADAILFVVDAEVGATTTDEALVRVVRRARKPVVVAANKVDSAYQEADAYGLWGLGLGEPFPVSAVHGRGVGDLLDAVLEVLPSTTQVSHAADSQLRRVALLGKPNVGKSSLLNRLAAQERVVVNEHAGTTRDPVNETIVLDGQPWLFVDTAGIRRHVQRESGADYYASLRTDAALNDAELALVLIDASRDVTQQDVRVMQKVVDAGRALVIVNNKWDLVDEIQRNELNRQLEQILVQLQWADVINMSALTGWHTNRLTRAMTTALESWDQRISTSTLNSFLGELVAEHPHPVRSGKQPRILFGTQASSRPPRFVLFTTGFLEAGYRRFIERSLREKFGFHGTPLEISVRPRERKKRR